MKKFLIFLAIVAAILLGLFLFLRAKLNPEALGEMLLEKVNAQEGLTMEAARFEVGIFSGLVLENATVTSTNESGSMNAQLSTFVVEYQLMPILKGELVIDRILIDSPTIEIVASASAADQEIDEAEEPAAPATEPEPAEATSSSDGDGDGFSPTLSIGELRINGASLTVRSAESTSPDLAVTGLDLSLDDFLFDTAAPQPILALRARGGISLQQVTAGELRLEGGRGELELAEGIVTITGLGISTPSADMEIQGLEADLGVPTMPFELTLTGKVDLDQILEVEGGGSFGESTLELALSGEGPDPARAQGDGTLHVPDGQLPSFKALELIERLLGGPSVSGEDYLGPDIVFHLSEGTLVLDPFELGLERLRLAAGGWVELAGPIDLRAAVKAPRESVNVKALDPFIDSLTDAEGWTAIPIVIGGTLEEPDVDVDLSSVKETAVDMGKSAAKNAVGGMLERETEKRRQKRAEKKARKEGGGS